MSLRILHTFLTAHMFAAIMLCLKPKGAERSDSVPVSAALYFLEFLVNANDLGSYFPQSNEAGPGPSLLRLGGAKCHGRRKSRIPGNEVRTYADGLVGSVFWAPQWLKPQTKLEGESSLKAKNLWHSAKWKWIVVAGLLAWAFVLSGLPFKFFPLKPKLAPRGKLAPVWDGACLIPE